MFIDLSSAFDPAGSFAGKCVSAIGGGVFGLVDSGLVAKTRSRCLRCRDNEHTISCNDAFKSAYNLWAVK